jgi:hypothetical protein
MTDAAFIAWLKSADCIRCALVEVVARVGGSETTLYLSNLNYVTSSSDTPASTAYAACVTGGVSFSETLSLDGTPNISWGDIEVDNTGGVRDAWLGYVWANRQVRVYMGDPRWVRSDFRMIFDGVVGDLLTRDAEVLNLSLLDKLQRLNNPVTEATLGGATDNKDRLLPLAFGECHNVSPLLTVPSTLTYQYHDGAAERLIEVRDNGAPITTYTSSLATGKFTLTAAPVGQITADVQGAKPSGTYSANISTLVQHIVQTYGPASTRFSSGDLDASNLSAFASAHPQPVGLCLTDRSNVLQVCQELAASVGAQIVVTTLGKLRLVQLALPASGTPTAVTAQDFDEHSLHVAERPAVRATAKLGWGRNWSVQTSGLATGLPASSAAALGLGVLSVTSSDATATSVYKLGTQPEQVDTLLVVEGDATTEAARRRDLWKTPRQVYEARYRAHLLLTELGDALTITHARFGLSGGVTGLVVRVSRDWLAGRVTIGVLA